MKWRNWSGSVTANPAEVVTPSSLDEIVALVKRCAAAGKTIRAVGAGHSFTPLVATDSVLVSLEHYAGIEHIDTAACTATVRAGTKLSDLGKLLFAHGLAQENLGDIAEQSIAGAISTGTHGTGISFGTLSTQVIGLTLVNGRGDIVTCSPDDNPTLFSAAQLSLGALGLIVSVTLRLVPAYALHIDIKKQSLSDVIANLDTFKQSNRHFEIQWIPYTDAVQAKFINMTDAAPTGKTFMQTFNEYALENGALWLFSAFNRQFPRHTERVCRTIAAFIADAAGISHAHQTFASARLVKFNEMEYNLPAEHFAAALADLDAMIRRERIRVHFPVECRFVRGDSIDLSPAHGRDSAYIAVHMFKGMPYQRYFDLAEQIFLGYGGRPHWGKLHTRTATDFAALYPRWSAFQQQRTVCDPNGLFTTPYLASILGKPS